MKVVDLAIAENKPTVFEFLEVLKKYFSAEKLIFAKETKEISPSMYQKISSLFDGLPVETISHVELKKRSKYVKAIIRTGDFTAFTNVLLISGTGTDGILKKNNDRDVGITSNPLNSKKKENYNGLFRNNLQCCFGRQFFRGENLRGKRPEGWSSSDQIMRALRL